METPTSLYCISSSTSVTKVNVRRAICRRQKRVIRMAYLVLSLKEELGSWSNRSVVTTPLLEPSRRT